MPHDSTIARRGIRNETKHGQQLRLEIVIPEHAKLGEQQSGTKAAEFIPEAAAQSLQTGEQQSGTKSGWTPPPAPAGYSQPWDYSTYRSI